MNATLIAILGSILSRIKSAKYDLLYFEKRLSEIVENENKNNEEYKIDSLKKSINYQHAKIDTLNNLLKTIKEHIIVENDIEFLKIFAESMTENLL
jgi:hypothetical protein